MLQAPVVPPLALENFCGVFREKVLCFGICQLMMHTCTYTCMLGMHLCLNDGAHAYVLSR